jgi:hypothetical protein
MGMGMDSPLAATPVTVRGVHAAGHLRRWNPRGWGAESAWGTPRLPSAAEAASDARRRRARRGQQRADGRAVAGEAFEPNWACRVVCVLTLAHLARSPIF